MRNLKKVLSLALAFVMLVGMMVVGAGAAVTTTKDYTDAASVTKTEAVDVMSAVGIFNGTDGAFAPQGNLTRAEAAAIITRMLLGSDAASALVATTAPYADVAANNWAAGAILYCSNLGIVSGIGNNQFGPAGNVTGNQFAKMLLVALGYDADIEGFTGSNWSVNVGAKAYTAGLMTSIAGNMNEALTRELAAQMAFNTLTADMVEYTNKGFQVGDIIVPGSAASKLENTKGNDYHTTAADQDENLQFCERYFPALKLNTSAGDSFGHEANVWTYGGAPVGTYATPGTVTFTAETKDSAVSTALRGYNLNGDVSVITNGKVDNTTYTAAGAHITAANIAALTGNGVSVELYFEENALTTVVVVKSVLAEVTKVDEAKGENTYKTVATDDAYAAGSQSFTSAVGYGAYRTGDKVMISVADSTNATLNTAGTVEVVTPVTVVSGLGTSVNTANKSITVNGTAYTMAKVVETEHNLAAFGVSAQYNATLYLDQYGFVVSAVAGQAEVTDKTIAVLRFYQTLVNGNQIAYMAQGVISDGSIVDVELSDSSKGLSAANTVYTYTINNGKYTLTAVDQDADESEAVAPVYGDAFSKKVEAGVGYDIAANALSATATYNTNQPATYYFASNVKFIYVNNGTATVVEGVQKVDDKPMTFVLGAKSGSTPLISAVYVIAEAPTATSTSDDLIFVKGGSTGKVVVADTSAPTGYSEFYTYDAWSNGAKIDNFYSAANIDVGTNAFYRTSVTASSGAYVLTDDGTKYTTTTGKVAVLATPTVVTNTLGSGIMTLEGAGDFNTANAQVIAVANGAPTSVSELKSDTKTASIVMIYNQDTKAVDYIFVTGWADKVVPPASAAATCETVTVTMTNKSETNGKAKPTATIAIDESNAGTDHGTGTIVVTLKAGGNDVSDEDKLAFTLTVGEDATVAGPETPVAGLSVESKTVTLTKQNGETGWPTGTITVTNGDSKVDYTVSVTAASDTIGFTNSVSKGEGNVTVSAATATKDDGTDGAGTLKVATSGVSGASGGDTITVRVTPTGNCTVDGADDGQTYKTVTLSYDGNSNSWSTSTVKVIAPAGNYITYTVSVAD